MNCTTPQFGRTVGYLITVLVAPIVSVWRSQVKVLARQKAVLSEVFVVFLVVLQKISGYI